MLSGSEIIHHKLNGPRELPACGWKEFCPSNSWLEQKQIQTSLEEKEAIIGLERIEKQTNLARAEWILDRKKAKVLKKVGKYWEVVGHHQDDEDWLFPEEALYLIEVNVLELYHDGVPVSVEHAYVLLLGDSRSCSLQEYRVYSYLSRRGYKLIRHVQDVTVTRYEKQINLDQVLESQKRSIPNVLNDPRKPIIENNETIASQSSDTVPESTAKQISKEINESDFKAVNDLFNNIHDTPAVISEENSERINESEDVYLIEDNIEIIEIEDNTKNTSKKKELVIVIDDEDGDNEEKIKKDLKTEDSDDDVILVKTVRLESRTWYKPLNECLVPKEVQVVDLCNDKNFELKVERDDCSNHCFDVVKTKIAQNILDEMVNASCGVSVIKAPNSILLPKNILPKHKEYKVNLNVRQERKIYPRLVPYPTRRPFYNNNHSNNYFSGQRNNSFGSNVPMFSEMKSLAFTMMQFASSLMSAANTQQNSSGIQNQVVSEMQHQNMYNPMQYRNYNPRHFNYNPFHNRYRNQRNNSYPTRNREQRRNYRGNRNSKEYTPNQRRVQNRYYNEIPNISDVVNIDSDEDSAGRYKRKRNQIFKTLLKQNKPTQLIEVIDLCDDGSSVKSETCEEIIEEKKFLERKNCEKRNISEGDFKMNKKPKQEFLALGKDEELDHHFMAHLQTKNEPDHVKNKQKPYPDDMENTELSANNSGKQEYSKEQNETEMNVDLNFQQQNDENDSAITEESNEKYLVPKDRSYSSLPFSEEIDSNASTETNNEVLNNVVNEKMNNISNEPELPVITEPTSWQQYKEQSEQIGVSDSNTVSKTKHIEALVHPDHYGNLANILADLQIFGSVDEVENEIDKTLKISFDVYLPTDHFKKTVKLLPKFRIIVVNSTDALPSKNDLNLLKTIYQDGIPFIYAVVYDEAITFYFYDMVSLPECCE